MRQLKRLSKKTLGRKKFSPIPILVALVLLLILYLCLPSSTTTTTTSTQPPREGGSITEPTVPLDRDIRELVALRDALRAYATKEKIDLSTADKKTTTNTTASSKVPQAQSVVERLKFLKKEQKQYKKAFLRRDEAEEGVTPEKLLSYHYQLPTQRALTGYNAGLEKSMNPNLYDALDSEEEKSIGELARFNAEAEREQQEVYSQFTTRSRLFWDSTAITRRGYGLESSIFVVHIPDALGEWVLSSRDQTPTETASRVRSSMNQCAQTVRSLYRHARWPAGVFTGVLEIELYHPKASVSPSEYTLNEKLEHYYDATNSEKFVFDQSFVFSCLPDDFVSPEQEERLSFSYKDNIRTKDLLFPLRGAPSTTEPPTMNDKNKKKEATHVDRTVAVRSKAYSPFAEGAFYREKRRAQRETFSRFSFSARPALLHALFTLYRGETYVFVLHAGVVLTPGWDWRWRVQYTHTLTPHQAVLSTFPKTLGMRELVNVIVAVVKAEFLQDPAVRQEATRRLLAAGKPTHTVRGHLSKNYLASVYMAVPLWGHDVLNDVKEGGNEYFSNADRLRYTNEVAEGSFLARMFMPVRKDETTLMPAIFSIDGKHTLAFHEAMQIMVGTNLSSDENRDITYDREYLFLIQKSCGHFVEKGRNKINKELYERCWFFEHQKALQEKLTYFTNRNSFDLNNDNASEEEKKQDADNRDGLIPIIQSQKGVLREVLVESPLCKPNNNKKCYSALHAPSYAKVRKLTDKEDRQKLESLVISKERVSPQHTLSPSQTKGEAVPLLNKDTNTVSILQSAVHMNFVFTVAETFFDYPQKLQCRVIFSQEEDERPTTSTSSIFQFPPAVPVDPLLQTVRSNDHSGKAEQEKSVYDLYWSARLFTAGWNSYAPTEVIGYKFDVEQALMDFYAEDEIVKEVKPSVENQTTVSNSTSHSGNTTADNNNTKTNTTVRDSGSSKKPSASQKQENSTQVDTLVELQSKTTLRMHEQLLKHKKKENNEHSFGLGSRRELSLFLELNEIDNFKGLFSFP